jgi:hypothetical protein
VKLLATSLACATILTSSVYAATTQHQRLVLSRKHPVSHFIGTWTGDVFLLEDRHATLPAAENFWDYEYPTMEH